MMRRPVVMRRGPGLMGMLVDGAVIGGTAAVVSNKMSNKQQAQQQQAQQQQAQQAQQAQAAQQTEQGAPAQAPSAADDIVAQLQQLAQLKSSGALTQEQFDAASAKILGTAPAAPAAPPAG